MRYWISLDAIGKRIVRVSSDLSTAMRAFCYTFILGMVLKPSFPIVIGNLIVDIDFAKELASCVFLYILLDLFHPLIYLFFLHIVNLARWCSYKCYNGKEDEPHNSTLDRSDFIIKLTPYEVLSINFIPNLLLSVKTIIVLLILIKLLRHYFFC